VRFHPAAIGVHKKIAGLYGAVNVNTKYLPALSGFVVGVFCDAIPSETAKRIASKKNSFSCKLFCKLNVGENLNAPLTIVG
jgi:hypothetical protein